MVRPAAPDDDVVPRDPGRPSRDEGEQVAGLWAELEQSDVLSGSLVAERRRRGRRARRPVARLARRPARAGRRLAAEPAERRTRRRRGRGSAPGCSRRPSSAARAGGTPLLFLEGDPGLLRAPGLRAGRPPTASPRRPARTPDPAFQVVRFDGHEDWMTGQVVYRDVWWRHDAAGLRDPLLAETRGDARDEVRDT